MFFLNQLPSSAKYVINFDSQMKTVLLIGDYFALMSCCVSLVAACRSVNTVLQKQLTEEKDSKEHILRERDQLAQVRRVLNLFLKPLLLLTNNQE